MNNDFGFKNKSVNNQTVLSIIAPVGQWLPIDVTIIFNSISH